MTPERAGPERASRGGVSLAWLHTNSEGPHRGMSPALGGIACAGESRLGRDAQPERPLHARGAKENLHGVENRAGPHAATRGAGKKTVTQ
jgi:hypothetical protein